MGFFDTAFGGSEQRSTSRTRFGSPGQQAAFESFFPQVTQLQNQFAADPSQLIAGFNPLQQAGQALGVQQALGLQPQIQQAQQALGQQLGAADIAGSPVFAAALQGAINPLVRSFQQDILPGIRSQAVGVGQPGSSREGIAQGLASQGLTQQISDLAAQAAQGAFQTGIGARGQALGLAPSVLGLGQLPSNILRGIGGEQQALEQRQLGAPIDFLSQIRGLLGQPILLSESESFGRSQPGIFSKLSLF